MNAVTVPPAQIRFMGETDEQFLPVCDHLACNVLARTGSAGLGFDVLDVGCGYGRLAYGLRRAGFGGTYRGFDILKDHIGWLSDHFATPDDDRRYRFDFFNVHNARYNPSGVEFETLDLPYEKASFDCITTFSVFTHMYEDDIRHYLSRIGALLRDGGVWIVTFFSLPDTFTLAGQNPAIRYPLTRQISDDAFIHNPAEPLHVIAYRESFLRKLIAEYGLEIAAHQLGAWLGAPAKSEFEDWFVLRKRGVAAVACNICGGQDFGRGPAGRLAASGIEPYCHRCESLERQRIGRKLLQALPIGYLDWRRCLQFSPDQTLNPAWFRSYELSVYRTESGLDIQNIARPAASYDFVTLSHVLECIPNDLVAFDELYRILAPRGVLHLGLAGATTRLRTVNFDPAIAPYDTVHLYGRDIYQRFRCADKQLGMLVVEGTDPVTRVRDVIHLFVSHVPDLALLRGWLASWDDSVVILDEVTP